MRRFLLFVTLIMAINIVCCGYEPLKPPSVPDDQDTTDSRFNNGSFTFDGQTRNYIVFVPKNYQRQTNLPMVIYLHSYGWKVKQEKQYTRFYEVADTAGFIVVYPSGIPNWNSGVSDNPGFPAPDVDDVGFINALIDTVSNHYSIDLTRVYACGYSNGGFMSYKLAAQLSDRIAAVASVGGVMSGSTATDSHPVRAMPVLEIHGTADWWVPFNGSEGWNSVDATINYWRGFDQCRQADTIVLPDTDTADSCTVEKITYSNCDNEVEVILFKVINGGHTWPGAGLPGYAHEGHVNNDIDANVEIWNFFKKYKLDQFPPVR